jgi:hypothetical protein
VTVVKRAGCCSLWPFPKKDLPSKIKTKLLANPKLAIPGHLTLGEQKVEFEENNANPFAEKVQIAVPMEEVKGYAELKIDAQEGVELLTNMGPIRFLPADTETLMKNL